MRAMKFALITFLLMGSPAKEESHYWVLETNLLDKSKSIIRYYDNSNQLISEEQIGRRLSVVSKHDRRVINKKMQRLLKR